MMKLGRSERNLLVFILIYSFIPAIGGLIRVVELAGGPVIAPQNPRALADPLPIVIHLISSFVFCIAGALQFLPSIRRSRSGIHRSIGRVIALAGCLSAASGMWMTHIYTFPQELQGSILYWVRMGLGTAMIGLIVWAVAAIKAGKVAQHGAAMVRAYAIAQGASTQTFLGLGWILMIGSEAMGPVREGMMVFAWGLNLLVAEVLIRRYIVQKVRVRAA